jgi:hypothetical protein
MTIWKCDNCGISAIGKCSNGELRISNKEEVLLNRLATSITTKSLSRSLKEVEIRIKYQDWTDLSERLMYISESKMNFKKHTCEFHVWSFHAGTACTEVGHIHKKWVPEQKHVRIRERSPKRKQRLSNKI